jgi:group II intron reverse transcriptase/maturase
MGGSGRLKVSRRSDDSRQLRIEDCPGGDRLEAESRAGVLSDAMATENGQADGQEVGSTLLEEILSLTNMVEAYKRVKSNKGAAGVDGMTVEELQPYMQEHGKALKQKILSGEYAPQPVRRVEIPKPSGGVRMLGIPTVVDRLVQQAMAQKLSPLFDGTFSNSSYGFRPGRSAAQAVEQARQYIGDGHKYVVDLDLAKYFDTVNHDLLMHLVSRKAKDKRVLKLTRAYLNAGMMLGGLVSATEEGVPQGGPLSPLLSNVMLDEFDKELEKRGHRFCRYADDCNIFLRTRKAGQRVMDSAVGFLEGKLKLKVNREKSAVDLAIRRKFLGFSFYNSKDGVRIRVHPKSMERLKTKLKDGTGRSNAMSMKTRITRLNQVIRGWVNYFCIADMKKQLQVVDENLRRRMRMCLWKQWKRIRTKHRNLVKLGVPEGKAWEHANTRKSYWRTAGSPILATTLTNEYFAKLGLQSLSKVYDKARDSRRTATCRTACVVV